MELRDRWNRLLPDAHPLGEDLLARYAEKHRRYHTQRHLTEALDAVDELAGSATDPDAVRLAIWFHDAIYDTAADPGENEEVSAQLAEAELAAYGVPEERVGEVGRLIRLTATHKAEPDDRNGALVCDADLRILSMDAERYDEYAEAIRAEYAQVPDRQFAVGRTAVLERLAASPLYATEHGQRHWEDAARANIDRELSTLAPRTVRPAAGLIPLIYLGTAIGAMVAAAVLLGRGLGAAPSWPAAPDWQGGTPLWAPITGTALATCLGCAWFRGVPARLLSGLAALLAAAGAAGIVLSWLRWPDARPGMALSDRWPYLLLASIAALLAGGLLALARRLRTTTMYSGSPGLALGAPVTLAGAVLLGWVLVAAGPPFAQARLEQANTISSVAVGEPGSPPVRLDGEMAWPPRPPAMGMLTGTAGGFAELRPDGVVMTDPANGRIRWRYARSDVNGAAGPDGHGVTVATDGRTLAVHLPYGGPPTSKLDLPSHAVLDAISGRVRTQVRTSGTALAVDGNRLIVAEGNGVASHQLDGPEHWRTRTNCRPTRAAALEAEVVVVDACGGQPALVRGLDAGTGEQRWQIDLGTRFEVGADSEPSSWIGDLTTVPGTRMVSGLVWTSTAGGTLQQWAVDAGEGRLAWTAPLPGTPRPMLGPAGCDAQLAATQAALVLIACRAGGPAGQHQVYDVAATNPTNGTPQWHHLLEVPLDLQDPAYPQEGFGVLPDGRVVTVRPQQRGGGCIPVLIGTTGVRPHEFAEGATVDKPLTCVQPRVTVAIGRPVISDGSRLFALR